MMTSQLERRGSDRPVQGPLQFSQGLGVASVNEHIGEVGEKEAEIEWGDKASHGVSGSQRYY